MARRMLHNQWIRVTKEAGVLNPWRICYPPHGIPCCPPDALRYQEWWHAIESPCTEEKFYKGWAWHCLDPKYYPSGSLDGTSILSQFTGSFRWTDYL